MSESQTNQEKWDWDGATEKAKRDTVFEFPEGSTIFSLLEGQTPQKSRYEGKWLLSVDIDGKLRTISIGGKLLVKISQWRKEGVMTYILTRIGTAMDTRYMLQKQVKIVAEKSKVAK